MSVSRWYVVSESAAVARVRRRMRKEGLILRKARSERERIELGEFYVVNDQNHLMETDANLLTLARESGALRPFETIKGYEETAEAGTPDAATLEPSERAAMQGIQKVRAYFDDQATEKDARAGLAAINAFTREHEQETKRLRLNV